MTRSPPSIPALWSAQFLAAITGAMTGTVLVVVPSRARSEPWSAVIPDDAFGGGAQVVRRPLAGTAGVGPVDHVVVPFAAAVDVSTEALVGAIRPLLREGGSVTALLPGRAWVPPASDEGPIAVGLTDGAHVATLARERFPDRHISVETFGNPVTAAAVAAGAPAADVVGVAIDHHDGHTEVLIGLCISRPPAWRHERTPTAPRSGAAGGTMTSRVRALARRYLPTAVQRGWRRVRRRPYTPPVGRVHFGDLRRTTPIATDFGYGRGGPVDRYYIESFLDRHRLDIRGRVLEIGDATYTHRFGGGRIGSSDVLHIHPDAPDATYVGDLADGSFLPADAFDCIVLTQTLHFIYDFAAALRTVARVLAPGGVLLMTVPGISNVDPAEWGPLWNYSFTQHSLRRMCADAMAGCDVEVTSYGNVLAAVAFLHGLGCDELTREELDDARPEYSLIHAVRVVKP